MKKCNCDCGCDCGCSCGSGVGKFVLGALVGGTIALLFTPRTGSENRKALKKKFVELLNKDTPLYKIFDKDKLKELLKIDEFDKPWYGQLMRYDAMLAWLYQIDYWLDEYKVIL